MKRSYNHSFVHDTHDISTSHFFGQRSLSQATLSSQEQLKSERHVYRLKNATSTVWRLRSPTLFLPNPGSYADFDFDFQSNAHYSQTIMPSRLGRKTFKFDSNSLDPGLSALGIDCGVPPVSPGEHDSLAPDVLSSSSTCSQEYALANLEAWIHEGHHHRLLPMKAEPPEELNSSFQGRPPSANMYHLDDSLYEVKGLSPSPSSSLPSLLGSTSEGYLSDRSSLTRIDDYDDLLNLAAYDNDSGKFNIPPIGLIADINMRQQALQKDGPVIGVRLADIECPLSDRRLEAIDSAVMEELGDLQYPLPPKARSADIILMRDNLKVEFSDEHISAIVSVLSVGVNDKDRNENKGEHPAASTVPIPVYVAPLPGMNNSYWPAVAPLNAVYPPQACVHPSLVPRQPLIQRPDANMRVHENLPDSKPIPQSPVRNAHRGITLQELRRRADDFRRQNPGYELDKTWLQDYAGRLNSEGQLMEDYRCYVIGCTQKNKRRDHILVHVGSHVEHRPFQCGMCGMRFLRKNECKRHESSHTGDKPFSCPICGEDRSFVRQDLLKRHLRISHGLESSRKRLRPSDSEEGYWP